MFGLNPSTGQVGFHPSGTAGTVISINSHKSVSSKNVNGTNPPTLDCFDLCALLTVSILGISIFLWVCNKHAYYKK